MKYLPPFAPFVVIRLHKTPTLLGQDFITYYKPGSTGIDVRAFLQEFAGSMSSVEDDDRRGAEKH